MLPRRNHYQAARSLDRLDPSTKKHSGLALSNAIVAVLVTIWTLVSRFVLARRPWIIGVLYYSADLDLSKPVPRIAHTEKLERGVDPAERMRAIADEIDAGTFLVGPGL